VIPFASGVKEVVAWLDAHPTNRYIDDSFNTLVDRIIAAYECAWPQPFDK
jgi:hypothetical protein